MKYKLIIDKNAEEEIIAIVHAPSSLTQQIENLICSFSGADYIMGYRDDEMRKLAFSEIECITILDRKVIAIDTSGVHYRIQDRLRDLEDILPSYFIIYGNKYGRPSRIGKNKNDAMSCRIRQGFFYGLWKGDSADEGLCLRRCFDAAGGIVR